MRKILILFLILGLLIPGVMADDSISSAGWIDIAYQISIDPTLAASTEGFNFEGDPVIFQTESNATPYYFILGDIWNLEGSGEWGYTFRTLDGAEYTGNISKTDHMILGIGRSDLNLSTDDGRWINVSVSQPRISPIISGNMIGFILASNETTGHTSLMAYNEHTPRILEIIGMNQAENPIIYFKLDGSDIANGKIFVATQEVLVYSERFEEPEGNFIDFGISVATGVYEVITVLWALFDWLVLKAGFILFILLIEGGMAAYYVNTSKDIFTFFRKFARGNKALFEFISTVTNAIIQILVNIKNSIPLLKYL